MNTTQHLPDEMPVVRSLEDFDQRSGTVFERAIFNNRLWIVIACALLSLLLGFQATKLSINAGFEKMIPHGHAYVKNYLESRGSLRGLGNSVRVVVENTDGDIFDPAYLEVLKQVNDELFLMADVDRAWMKSIWTPAVRWSEVNEEGFVGGPVMPDNYDGTPGSVDALKLNIRRANIVGNLVANDFRSSMVFVPLLERNADTGERLDYHAFSQTLEQNVRAKYEKAGHGKVKIHVIGFAKLAGDLIDGLVKVASFFLVAALIAALIIFLYTRCVRSTVLVVACSVVAVVWQLGLVRLLGFELDPFSVLVPFLIFAIGVSHGAQKMNGIMQDVGRGTHRLVAARYTFRRLFLAGLTALLADVVGFAVLMTIDIPVIKELALTASIGVGVLVFTNLILLPVLLSYVGVSPAAAKRSLRAEDKEAHGRGLGAFWNFLDRFTERRWALGAIAVAVVLAAGGLWMSRGLQIGDLDPGAPELRKDSRYNQDNAYITGNYALSSDLFAVIVKTKKDACLNYKTLVQADRLGWALQQDPSVQTTVSLADAVRNITAGSFEGNPKWLTLNRNQDVINYSGQQATVLNPDLFNTECSVLPVIAYLADHKADSLKRVAAIAEDFAARHNDEDVTLQARRRLRRDRGRHQRSGQPRQPLDAAVRLRRGGAAVLHRLPQLARGGRRGAAADPDLDPVRGADGAARHRRQGRDPAGDRARRRHRRRLRAVPAQRAAGAAARRCAARRRLPACGDVHRQGGRAGRHHPGRGRHHLGVLADQVPGRHGHPAHLHVRVEHDRRAGAHSGALAFPAAQGGGMTCSV